MADADAPAPAERSGDARVDPLIGRVINDRFRIVSVIARGGMGKVYRAEQAPLGREIALKVLHPSYQGDSDPEFHKRFFLEASTQSKLTHPNTVTIFDYGKTDDDVYFIAMELLEGRTLHRTLRDDGALPPERALHIAQQMCRSLREAHSLGVIHRDLKPANVFLVHHAEERDFVKVLDFGLVKDLGDMGEDLTQTGLFMGSPKYMSPEQIRGEVVDGRCDVYALGVMLYEMLSGKVPFQRANSVNILMAHVHDAVPTVAEGGVAVSPVLEAIIQKALAKNPDDRFADMDAFLVALKEAAGGDLASGGFPLSSQDFSLSSASFPPSMIPHGVAPGSGMVTTPPAAASSRTKWLVAFAALALVVVGVAFFVQSSRTGERGAPVVATPLEVPPTPAADPTPPETMAPEPPPAAPVAQVVNVHLESIPAGATVTIGEETHQTPIDLEWRGADAARGRTVTFHFQLEGHRDYTAVRTVLSDSISLVGRLSPREAPRRMRRPSSRTRRTTEMRPRESVVGPMGYKQAPY